MKRKVSMVVLRIILSACLVAATGCAEHTATPTATPATTPVATPIATPATKPAPTPVATPAAPVANSGAAASLLYQGHGSIRIVSGEGKVIYIDPYAGEGYDLPADLILITHGHGDHTAVELIETQNDGCQTITHAEALSGGQYATFELGFVTVEAVQAGNNERHDINECVGYVLTVSGGQSVYISGDTSTTEQMKELAGRSLDYAFFCCDGVYNMDAAEATACAELVQAKASIPYHIAPGELFNREIAEQFTVSSRMILEAGEEIEM